MFPPPPELSKNLPLFEQRLPLKQRRTISGFDYHDNVRWEHPQYPSRATTGKVLGYSHRCTRLVIGTSDGLIVTLDPLLVVNTSRTSASRSNKTA